MSFPTTTLLDDFKRTENPLSNGGKWTKLNWASAIGRAFSEVFGWVATSGGGGAGEELASGAYWNVTAIENPAVCVRQYQEEGNDYTGLWACTTGEGTRNGYRMKFTFISGSTVAMTLEKWVGGVRTELAKVEFAVTLRSHETAFGLTVSEGKVKGWYGATEAAMAVKVEAADATFTTGKVGIENNKNNQNGATDFRAGEQAAAHLHTLEASQPQKASATHSLEATRSVSQAQSAKATRSLTTTKTASQKQSAALEAQGVHEHLLEVSQKSNASMNTSRRALTASQSSTATVTKHDDSFHATQTATQASGATLAKTVARTLSLTNALSVTMRFPKKEPVEGSGTARAEGSGALTWKHQPLTSSATARAVGVGFLTFTAPSPIPPSFDDLWFYGAAAFRREMPGSGEAVASGDSVLAT